MTTSPSSSDAGAELGALAALRAELPAQLAQSALTDAARFTRELERTLLDGLADVVREPEIRAADRRKRRRQPLSKSRRERPRYVA